MCIIYHDPHVVASLGFFRAKPWGSLLSRCSEAAARWTPKWRNDRQGLADPAGLGNGWAWWEWGDKCGLKKGHWCGKLMHKIPGSLQRELETSRNVDDGPGLVDFSHGFSKVSCATEVMTRKVGCDSQLWLGCVPWNLGWKWGKAGRFQVSVCSRHDLGWLRMQMDAASDDFFNTDHSMFWCLAIILRCFQPPSWMSFRWPSNCERSATLWRKSLEWTTLLTNLGTFWPLHSWWLICVLLEFPAFQATICCKML